MEILIAILGIIFFIIVNLAMDKDSNKKKNNIDYRWKKNTNLMDENNKSVQFEAELRGSHGAEKKELAERNLYDKLDGENIEIEKIEMLAKNLFKSDYKTQTEHNWQGKRKELASNTSPKEINIPLPFPSISKSYNKKWKTYDGVVWFRKKMANELYENLNKDSNIKLLHSKLEELELVGIPSYPVEGTGDIHRQSEWRLEVKKKEQSTKYLYLVQIKSRVDDKNYIKIGITSKNNIKKRFEEDDVMELKKVIRSEKLETKLAISAEYFLIRKYRPKDYYAEKEFDAFSRFGGYTEVVPMRNTTAIGKDIDKIAKNSREYASLLESYIRLFD